MLVFALVKNFVKLRQKGPQLESGFCNSKGQRAALFI
jgi:hypothetical protein